MLYFLLRPLTRLAFLAFYRKIHLTGVEHIPTDKPLIFTANHPTAFIEPCFLACFTPRVLHFMTRGDVFAHPWVSWLLRQVHLIPIYRFHDGFSALRRNDLSFAEARKVLGRGGAILIMAEGRMAHEKRLRPLQKGAARIGFGAMEEFDLHDVMVQPVGINYTYADRARTIMMVDFAPAFSLQEYLHDFRAHPQNTLQDVTDRIRVELEARVVHIGQREDEDLAEQILRLVRIHHPSLWPVVTHDRAPLLAEVRAMQYLDNLDTSAREVLLHIGQVYDRLLKETGIQDVTVASMPVWSTWKQVALWLMQGIRKLSYLCQFPPLWFGRWITARTVRVIEFRSSVLMGATMFAWAVWVGLVVAVAGILGGWMAGLIVLAAYAVLAAWYTASGQLVEQLEESRTWSGLTEGKRKEIREAYDRWQEAWGRVILASE